MQEVVPTQASATRVVAYLASEAVFVNAEAEGQALPEFNAVEGLPKGGHGLRISLLRTVHACGASAAALTTN